MAGAVLAATQAGSVLALLGLLPLADRGDRRAPGGPGVGELPADLNLAMVPGQPTGEEHVDASDLETVDAASTGVVGDD